MNRPRPLYSVLVLFGKEIERSVTSPANFVDLTDWIANLLAETGCRVKARGTIHAARARNVAPRRGFWSPSLRDQFLQSLRIGSLLAIELFDSRWSNAREPDAFGTIHRLWDLGAGGPARTDIGAENNVTIAIREDLVRGAFERLRAAAPELLEKIDGFYGTIESGVPWDQEIAEGIFEDLVDVRWHDRGDNDYGNGEYRMEKMVPRLNRGNILCRTQFMHYDLDGLRKLPGVTAVEKWPRKLTYLELKRQPAYGAKPAARFAEFIRMVPGSARTGPRGNARRCLD